MRVGVSLHGKLLSEGGARFASQLGVSDVVVHLIDYRRRAPPEAFPNGGPGPLNGDCIGVPLWDYLRMAEVLAMLGQHGLRIAAIENVSPNFWSDILLDGPLKHQQMEGMKALVRDAGRAGIPVTSIAPDFNLSIASSTISTYIS